MISIIVPVYNVKKYIIKCLYYLSIQDFNDYEVIVVDDGSTDGSSQLVDMFCRGKEKFAVYHKENGGLMSAWMEGIKHISGDYIGFVDSDDYPSADMFRKMYSIAKEHHADIVYCDYYAMTENETVVKTIDESVLLEGLYTGENIKLVKEKIFPSLIGGCISNARWNKIFRSSLFIPNTKYCECLSKTFEDRYIVPACVLSANSFYYLKQPLYYYLHREGSNCGKPKDGLLLEIKRMNECQRLALEDKGIMNQYIESWENARLDSVKQFVRRNIIGYGSFELAMKSSRELLEDKEYCSLIKKYRNLLMHNGKLSLLLVLAVELNIPFILVAARLISKRRYQS